MKKIVTLSFFLFLFFNLSSCKSETKKEDIKEVVVKKTAAFSLESAKNNIVFTAYKTTEKIGVDGQFKKVNIISGGEGNSIKEAISNTEFSIPISSLFTKDSSRDYKIKKFFFGIMDNTKLLSGRLTIENDSIGSASIKMNGVTEKIPFNYTINNNIFAMNAKMDVSNWNALEALASLNKVCEVLHTGSDGVSKTWREVSLNITSKF
jgi:hypothetical protein|tara:strand:+ start:95 stop:715 length:621 start_codon:yes stop_codon:yes gene_type:complete